MSHTLKQSLKPGLRYVVTEGSRCKTFQVGDRISVSSGRLNQLGGGGLLYPGQWERFRCAVRLDVEHYQAVISRAKQEIEFCEKVLRDNT